MRRWQSALSVLFFSLGAALTQATVTRTFTIPEPLGLNWGPDRVTYRVEFPPSEVAVQGLRLTDAAGQQVPAQLSAVTLWPDGKSVKSADLSFMVSLAPDQTQTWTLQAGREPVNQPRSDLLLLERGPFLEMRSARVGLRLPAGVKTFAPAVAADQIPAPVQALRLADGRWVGKGWWQTGRLCRRYEARVLERGPVFVKVGLRYDFTDDTSYQATVELSAGQDLAVISESFDLSQGERYEFPEITQSGEKYAYAPPHFDPPEQAMLWDWWGGAHGKVPAPHAYFFSFHAGLEPDSAEWYGRMYHEAAKPGDGGLRFDKEGRIISLNAFFQWGDEDSIYFGAYNSQRPEQEVAVVTLRPGQWLHPTIEPSPLGIIKQWTATNNLWIERSTAPDLWLKAPTCLGKRVYGIGVLERRPVDPNSPELAMLEGLRATLGGVPPVAKQGLASDIMLRHVRFGRLRLDEVKDWILDYPEPGRYPRLTVPPGQLARLQTRGRALPPANNFHYDGEIMYLQQSTPEVARRLLDHVTGRLATACRKVALHTWDHNSYAMDMSLLTRQVDVALGAPECTLEQAALIRRYLAFLAYFSLSPDYVPPREAGYGWGSANMMEALRGRGAANMAALLPGHPEGKRWRRFLQDYLIANAKVKINEAGGTLEAGAYGAMGVEFATLPLYALANCGDDVDLTDVLPRLRAAARHRLSVMLPYDLRGDFRPACTFGDSPYGAEGSLAYLALLFSDREPQLFRQLAWGVRESRSGAAQEAASLLFDPESEVTPPALASEYFPGCGFVMRNGFPARDETYVSVHAEGHFVGHGHNDQGSFVLYAQGAPLMLDFASQYVPSLSAAWVHNGTITFDHQETVRPCPGRDQEGCWYQGKLWSEHKVEPFTCLEPGMDPRAKSWAEAMAKVARFTSRPAADYAELTWDMGYLNRTPYMLQATHGQILGVQGGDGQMLQEPIRWRRQYVLVKSPDRTRDYLVLRDYLSGGGKWVPALNFWCLADNLTVNGPRATFTGQHGVDMEIYVAEPQGFTAVSHRVSHVQGRELGKHYEQTFGKPFQEEQILLRLPGRPGEGFFTVLLPRKQGDPTPTFQALPDDNGVRLTFADGRVDTVVLCDQPREVEIEGRRLAGSAFLATRGPDGTPIVIDLGQPERGTP